MMGLEVITPGNYTELNCVLSEMIRNVIESDFRISKIADGGHLVKQHQIKNKIIDHPKWPPPSISRTNYSFMLLHVINSMFRDIHEDNGVTRDIIMRVINT